MLQYEVWPQSAPDTLNAFDDFIDGDFHTKRRKLNDKSFLYAFLLFFGCVDDV